MTSNARIQTIKIREYHLRFPQISSIYLGVEDFTIEVQVRLFSEELFIHFSVGDSEEIVNLFHGYLLIFHF